MDLCIREVTCIAGADYYDLIHSNDQPLVLRGLVSHWSVVAASQQGDSAVLAYLRAMSSDAPVPFVVAAPDTFGRMHYDSDLRGFNFRRGHAPLGRLLDELAKLRDQVDPPAMAAQGVLAEQATPEFCDANQLHWLPDGIKARLWIGNRVEVAIHSDPADNLACVGAGRRRFTMFAPEQLPNLAMGPFDPTPAGTPISVADPLRPNFIRFPRFKTAMESAQIADLHPGDAIFIPYHWYHHVQSLDPVSILVNHWWNDAPSDGGSPWDAMLHAIMTIRHLPPSQRQAWQAMFNYYAFLSDGDPKAHLPEHAHGILGADSPTDRSAMRQVLLKSLQGNQ
jgi:hypothetical protein